MDVQESQANPMVSTRLGPREKKLAQPTNRSSWRQRPLTAATGQSQRPSRDKQQLAEQQQQQHTFLHKPQASFSFSL